MRRRRRVILERILARPTPSDIRWEEIESLMGALGVAVIERAGSRVTLKKGAARIVVHRPHPRPVTGRETIRALATFLRLIGADT